MIKTVIIRRCGIGHSRWAKETESKLYPKKSRAPEGLCVLGSVRVSVSGTIFSRPLGVLLSLSARYLMLDIRSFSV
ncbi:hypothetical protein [Kiloniella sp.]|uniref:hypothetical protein n=1 Tax=Kiloniella sp. TaxID=1938587 RepID=UPI003A9330BE